MDRQNNAPTSRRVRKPNPMRVFKEQYLPFLILGAAALMILIFLIGSKMEPPEETTPSTETQQAAQLLEEEVKTLTAKAKLLAEAYDYAGAMEVLSDYSAGMGTEPRLVALYNEYRAALDAMVVWNDLSQVPGLSFRTLVADLEKAKTDPERSSRYQTGYVTTKQFEAILQQLYDNGFVLVSLYDFATPATDADGKVTLAPASIRLPEGKKPLILTQEGVNYYSYTQNCGGFASYLTLDADGALTCAMTTEDGSTVTGSYDLIPILNAFLKDHPDFSYGGARATIAVSGYDGLFGYDLKEEAKIQQIQEKLLDEGYDIACYTYADMRYGDYGVVGIQEDLDKWTKEVAPLLGSTDILVYPTGGDLTEPGEYSGDKYDALDAYGFRYYCGIHNGTKWGLTTQSYARHARTLVTPGIMTSNPEYYNGFFDPAAVLAAEG